MVQTWFSGRMQVWAGFPSFQMRQVVTGQWTVKMSESQSAKETSVRTTSNINLRDHTISVRKQIQVNLY
jgi:hypothetical protein